MMMMMMIGKLEKKMILYGVKTFLPLIGRYLPRFLPRGTLLTSNHPTLSRDAYNAKDKEKQPTTVRLRFSLSPT